MLACSCLIMHHCTVSINELPRTSMPIRRFWQSMQRSTTWTTMRTLQRKLLPVPMAQC